MFIVPVVITVNKVIKTFSVSDKLSRNNKKKRRL